MVLYHNQIKSENGCWEAAHVSIGVTATGGVFAGVPGAIHTAHVQPLLLVGAPHWIVHNGVSVQHLSKCTAH